MPISCGTAQAGACPGLRGRPVFGALLFCVGLGVGAAGQCAETGPQPAVARVTTAGYKTRSHCTGFALAGGYLVTAAHCLPVVPGDSLHFLFGYDQGRYDHHVQIAGAEFQVLPQRDIAVACTRLPVAGLALAAPNLPDRDFTVPGYGLPAVYLLRGHDCRSDGVDDALRLNCPQRPGSSGAPVLTRSGQTVAGVMSAGSATRSVATRLTAADLPPCPGRKARR